MNERLKGISVILPLTPVRLKRHAAEIFGSKQGVVCEDSRFTYREFNERADRLSDTLLRLGINPRPARYVASDAQPVYRGHPAPEW